MDNVLVRNVTPQDAEVLSRIYAPYVEKTAISFEYEAPSAEEFRGRIENTIKKYPYICAEKDGKILGYAYASKFHPRAAYAHCAEASIYIDRDVRKVGLGRKLYEELEKRLREMGITNLYVLVAYPIEPDEYLDYNSAEFHEHMGFEKVGELHRCGFKFGRYYNVIYMEKML